MLRASLPHIRIGLGAVALILLTAGCGGSDQDRPTGATGLGGAAGDHDVLSAGPCEEGYQQTCSATIHQANGIKSCFRGTQFCVDGRWSECLASEDDLGR